MIIWINGTFGSGKTQTAYELHRRVENSYVYDPENAGYFIQSNFPKRIRKDDFQKYAMWREFNFSMLSYLDREYDGILIVPMTLAEPTYFQEIVGKLRADGITVNHFTLCASKEIVLKRLRSRGERSHSWAAQQADRCLEGLKNEIFQTHIDTNNHSIEDNVEYIAAKCNIQLRPDNRGRIRKGKDRLLTQFKHIRWFR